MSFKFESLDNQTSPHLIRAFPGFPRGFVRSFPGGLFFSSSFQKHCEYFKNFKSREDDTWIVTFPRSGTTWTQEMIWLLSNDLDFDGAKQTARSRFPFLEESIIVEEALWYQQQSEPKSSKEEEGSAKLIVRPEEIESYASPRFIKTHLPLENLPDNLLDSNKVIYVARNPKDVAVSYYFMHHLSVAMTTTLSFKEFVQYFMNDEVIYAPYWNHVLQAWKLRNHPNMLFLFYEDLKNNLKGEVKKAAEFLDKEITEEQIEQLAEHLNFYNMKKNPAINCDDLKQAGAFNKNQDFIREGNVGGWTKHFDEETSRQFDEWIEEHIKNTDLNFSFN